jgi:hypothetical protein
MLESERYYKLMFEITLSAAVIRHGFTATSYLYFAILVPIFLFEG